MLILSINKVNWLNWEKNSWSHTIFYVNNFWSVILIWIVLSLKKQKDKLQAACVKKGYTI